MYFSFYNIIILSFLVHLVLHPHGIAPTFLKLDSWSPGAGFIPIISTKGINQIKKGKLLKKLSFMHTKRFNTFFKGWVKFRVGAISRLPSFLCFFLNKIEVYIFKHDYIEYNDIQNKIFPNFQLDQCSCILNNPESSGSSITESIVRKTSF